MGVKKNSSSIHGIEVLADNIVWVWAEGDKAVVIDPSISEPISHWLTLNRLTLIAILQTHHHEDHIGGTKGLLRQWPNASVIASKSDLRRIPLQTISVADGDTFRLMGSQVKVLGVQGHTNEHIAFYIERQNNEKNSNVLFCGDTLFGAGCGRIFEGTFEDMYKSLQIINSLPEETEIYCAHEYTVQNLEWALSLKPNDSLIVRRFNREKEKRGKGLLTIPSTLKEEKNTNLFLQAQSLKDFIYLREHKNNWRK